jgi:hypothetical protein
MAVNYVQPHDLRSQAVRVQLYHVYHVLQFVGYKVGYNFPLECRTKAASAERKTDGGEADLTLFLGSSEAHYFFIRFDDESPDSSRFSSDPTYFVSSVFRPLFGNNS